MPLLSPSRPAAASPAAHPSVLAPPQRSGLALALQATVLSHARSDAAGTAFATEVALAFGCERVTLGFLHNSYARIEAVSHGLPGRAVGQGFELVAAAMDEALDQGISLALPLRAGSAAPGVRLAHTRLQQRQGGAVASVPLVHLGDGVGALCCEWASAPADLPERVAELENLVSLVGPVLYLMREAQAGTLEQLRRALRAQWKVLHSPRARTLRWSLAAVALALSGLLAVPVPHRIGGHARIEAEQQRTLAAPMNGLVKTASARPGDRVKQGQVLVEMADQDLQLQARKWAGELAQHENAYATALARSDRTNMVIGFARAEEARAQLGLIDAELARTRLVAPFDGVVISGDLSQSLGAPVERGQPLMVLAPGDRYRVTVQIDEADINHVQAGQDGTLALSALPWNTLPVRVTRVTPIARTVEGSNVFDVETSVGATAGEIRPGLEGSAKIDVGRQPLGQTLWQRGMRWVRMASFAWTP